MVFLPLCHIFGRDVAITLPLISRLVPHFGEDVDDLLQTMFEVAPTVLFTVPRYMQKFASQVLVGLSSTSPRQARGLRRRDAARPRLRAPALGRARPAPRTAVMQALARRIAFGRMLNKLGLDQLELVISGGAPLPPETAALWQIWGVNLVEVYGQTETGGAFITRPAQARSRGPAMSAPSCSGWEVRLDDGRRDPGARPRSVRGLLEPAGRDAADRRCGRLAAHRRCRRMAGRRRCA